MEHLRRQVVDFLKSQPQIVRIALVFAAFAFGVLLFASIADEVVEGDSLAYDRAVLLTINQTVPTTFDSLFVIGTAAGGVVGVAAIAAIVLLMLVRQRKWRRVVFFVSSVGGALLLNIALKLLFARERPDLWSQLIVEDSFSFPSGHAMASSALAASLVLLLWRTKWRAITVVAAVIYVLFIGFSRLYLGVHYPTDVLAGWCISIAWASVSFLIVLMKPSARKTRG